MSTTTQQPTCEERIVEHLHSCLDDIRVRRCPDYADAELVEDTPDHITIQIDADFRFDFTEEDYRVSLWRDEQTGRLDLLRFLEERENAWDVIQESMRESFEEYGLGFDYVPSGTFNDQDEPYFRYQISWGGPSDEFRFFADHAFNIYRIEYWFMDWWDGARRVIDSHYGASYDMLKDLWEDWKDCEILAHLVEKASE